MAKILTLKLSESEKEFLIQEAFLELEILSLLENSTTSSIDIEEELLIDMSLQCNDYDGVIGFDSITGEPNGERGRLLESIIDKITDLNNEAE